MTTTEFNNHVKELTWEVEKSYWTQTEVDGQTVYVYSHPS